jgi:hypothetical protein
MPMEFLDSNLIPEMEYTDWGFSRFSSILPCKFQESTSN